VGARRTLSVCALTRWTRLDGDGPPWLRAAIARPLRVMDMVRARDIGLGTRIADLNLTY